MCPCFPITLVGRGGIPGLHFILIMHKRRFHFVIAGRLQDHSVACPQLRKEKESAARALLKNVYQVFPLPTVPITNWPNGRGVRGDRDNFRDNFPL